MEHHQFMTWYPCRDFIELHGDRVVRWTVNMLPNPEARYTVVLRESTEK